MGVARMSYALLLGGALMVCVPPVAAQSAPPGPIASVEAKPADASVLASGPGGQVTRTDLDTAFVELVPEDQRKGFWLSPDAVRRMVRSLYAQRVLAAEATRAGAQPVGLPANATATARERALVLPWLDRQAEATLPDDKMLQSYARSTYLAKPEQFTTPDRVRVRHILLAVTKDGSDAAAVKAEAEALLARLRAGADFAALAREKSADKGSAERGGDLGEAERGRMVPALEEAAFGLGKPGELAGPVKTPFGYHVIELVERQPKRLLSFEEAWPLAREQMRERMADAERRRLWEAAEQSVQLHDEAINAMIQSQAKL